MTDTAEAHRTLLNIAKQRREGILCRRLFVLAIRIEGTVRRLEPIAEIRTILFGHVLGTVLTTFAGHRGIEIDAHFADMQVCSAVGALVPSRQW